MPISQITDWITAIATAVIALGVPIGVWQLILSRQQMRVNFEERFNAEYRELLKEIPVNALRGAQADLKQEEDVQAAFFRYFDLTNEQIYYLLKGRIDDSTWEEWRAGIKHNMSLPAFKSMFEELRERHDGEPELFAELELFRLVVIDGMNSSKTVHNL